MLLQPDQPQVHLFILFLLRGGAQLLFLLVFHPSCQSDDRQGERLLFHALRQLLQEHHHVRQLRPQHQVLDLPSALWSLQYTTVLQNHPHCCRRFLHRPASVKGSKMRCNPGSRVFVLDLPPNILEPSCVLEVPERCRPTFRNPASAGTVPDVLELSDCLNSPKFRILEPILTFLPGCVYAWLRVVF